jgi:hypothetical protein
VWCNSHRNENTLTKKNGSQLASPRM